MAKPIVKWAGGKTMLLGELLHRVPDEVRTYREPFAGGAALFFALADGGDPRASQESPRRPPIARAVLADQNEDLVACYNAVKSEVDALIEALRGYRYEQDFFYEVRAQDPTTLSPLARAARLIYLNKTCFNGLWRVNASGRFNVPFGRYANPKIVDEPALRSASRALRKAEVLRGDFLAATKDAKAGDFVYFDPPYVPLTKTALFTDYVAGGFGPDDQTRLADELSRLQKLGVRAMLSNADSPESRALYEGFAVHVVRAPRRINSDSSKRGETTELLVTTWEAPGIYEGARAAKPRAALSNGAATNGGSAEKKASRGRATAEVSRDDLTREVASAVAAKVAELVAARVAEAVAARVAEAVASQVRGNAPIAKGRRAPVKKSAPAKEVAPAKKVASAKKRALPKSAPEGDASPAKPAPRTVSPR